MAQPADYLRLTAKEARAQWRSLRQRDLAPVGRRQVDFLPVETLLCLAASLVVNHRQYGGSTAHRAESPVPELASLFKRPNSSILAKMANLDGSRRHAGRHELAVAQVLLSQPGEIAELYRTILAAARNDGVTETSLPDFLRLEEGGAFALLGQEELEAPILESALTEELRKWRRDRPDIAEKETERLLVAAARIGQHRFAKAVLVNCGGRCVFCGFSVHPKSAPKMIVASHIKPWRDGDARERLDFRNGLAACPVHDVAFDGGLLTIDQELGIHVAPAFGAAVQADPPARFFFGHPPLLNWLLLPVKSQPPHPEYLDWHRRRVAVGDLGT